MVLGFKAADAIGDPIGEDTSNMWPELSDELFLMRKQSNMTLRVDEN